MGAGQKNCFLWVPKVTGSILSGCILLGMGSNPAVVPVFRNRPPKDIEPTAMVGCKWTYQRTDHNAFSDNFMPVQIYLHYIYTVYQCADANMYIPIMYVMSRKD